MQGTIRLNLPCDAIEEPPDRQTPYTSDSLAGLVERYGDEIAPEWLKRLHLERPRKTIACLSTRTRLVKRLFDIVTALLLAALTSPLMILVAALIKLTSPGPVIYRQIRVGLNMRGTQRDRRQKRGGPPPGTHERRLGRERRRTFNYGRPFVLYKFRTMYVDAEKHGPRLAQENDPRVTPLGRLLRRTRLDELPQLWNVLRGDMSMVGPRPERPEFIARLSTEIPDYLQRLGLKPGLTGLAQIINGYDSNLESIRRKVALDLLYLQNCCLINDLKILLRTVGVVITGKGAV